jgi:hypothetical protein
MAEKKKARVRILDKKKIVRADALRVVVKGGNTLVLKVLKPLNNKRQLILQDGNGTIIVTSINRLARDIEEYLKMRGMEPIYVYPAFQQTLPSE